MSACHGPAVAVPARTGIRRVAVVGNPNAGKTTLFNALTGLHQKVANYAGVTVERVSGTLRGHPEIEVADVPGLYSLNAVSEDERVAVAEIVGELGERPDLLVVTIDATNLERNLYLYTQIAERGVPVVVALTMTDRLRAKGVELDLPRLSNLLGTEVVPLDGKRGRGMTELIGAIERGLETPRLPSLDLASDPAFEGRVAALRERLARSGFDVSRAELVAELATPTKRMLHFASEIPELNAEIESLSEALPKAGHTPTVDERYRWSAMVQAAVTSKGLEEGGSLTDRIDSVLTHRVFGLVIFIGLMYLVFQSIYSFSGPLMDLIESGFGALADWASPKLEGSPVIQSLIVDGLIAGVGGVLVFLPQILILFGLVAILEGSGYLARAAFLMDRLLGWCGLNGRAFIPLLSSFACAIPGVMAARVMPDARSRLATILVAPLMSCSARLPVYIVLIGAVIRPRFGDAWAGFALFAMHMLGLILAVPIAWILNRRVVKGKRLPFMLELPPYQWPRVRDVLLAMWFRGKTFVQTAGTTIVAMSLLIWAAAYFPRLSPEREAALPEEARAEAQLEGSYLGRFGKSIEPAFAPAGFDWRITTSILSAFPAREVVVPSLGILFSLGEDQDEESADLVGAIQSAKRPNGQPLFNAWNSVGLMVFFALCAQCLSTLVVVGRETGSRKWPWFMFGYMTALAYLFAVGIYQLGRALGHVP